MTQGPTPGPARHRPPRAATQSADRLAPRRELAEALAARADECVRLVEERLQELRWVGTHNGAYIEQRPAVIWLSTLLVARWLASNTLPAEAEIAWISERGRRAADEEVSVINLVRANLVWRDTVTSVLREEARRLKTPRRVVDRAIGAVRYNCDAGIIRTVGEFDSHLRSIAARLEVERTALRQQALHDPLTGVANRSLLLSKLRSLLQELNSRLCAVLLLDIDDFKRVNDELGHEAGDALLINVCRRLQAAIRPTDTLARLGGDELSIVLANVADADEAGTAASRIARAFDHPFNLSEGRRTRVRASVGVATGCSSDSATSVLRRADAAMYRAKAAGKDRVVVDGADIVVDARAKGACAGPATRVKTV